MEKKFEITNVLFIFCILIGITSLGIGVAFSYFRADIKGDKVNSIESSSIKLIYTEQQSSLTALIATDDYAIENSGYFNFSVKSESNGSTKLEYYVYIDEDSNNTISKENVKYLLTDYNDIPISDEFKDLENKYCYDYSKNEKVSNSFCTSASYLIDLNYINNVTNNDYKICKNTLNETVDTSLCTYGYVYKAKGLKLSSAKTLERENVIYEDTLTFTNGVSDKESEKVLNLRVWANNITNTLEEVNSEDSDYHEITTPNLTFNFKVNVFGKQVELGS